MILAIDVGNTNIVLGAYQNETFRFVARMATDTRLESDQYAFQLRAVLSLYKFFEDDIEGIVLSSVVPGLTPVILKALSHFYDKEPMILSTDDTYGVTIDIENPQELGQDILASAIAVRHTMPLPAIIIDMGTATKITALDEGGILRGVAISPGLYVSLDALVSEASALGGIALEPPVSPIGRNTSESMKSGVVLGTASMLDGMIDRFKEEMGNVKTIVATGGAASIITKQCRHDVAYSDTLLLDGMFIAYRQKYPYKKG